MKAKRSNKNVSPHGGIVPILKQIKQNKIPQVIRGCLGKRKEQSKYEYEDIFIAWVLTSLCGGTRLDHISKMKKKLSIIPRLKLPSHDTLGRVMKKLATDTFTKRNISATAEAKISFTKYNDNVALNRMLIKATKRMGLLQEGRKYTLDIDATYLATRCFDAVLGGKKKIYGYSPMVCLVGNLPVYISLRSGNASPSFQIADVLKQCIMLLEESNIKISCVVSDAAGQTKDLIEFLDSKGIKFNIRMPFRKNNLGLIKAIQKTEWRRTEIETTNTVWQCEISDVSYKMFESDVKCKVVCLRYPNPDTRILIEDKEETERRASVKKKIEVLEEKNVIKKPGELDGEGEGWVDFQGYHYKLIITNDFVTSSENLILQYNKRGGAERNFDFLKNDFGWRFPPFMNMNENIVFLIAASLANNIFRGVVKMFKDQVPELRLNARLKEFQFIFIDVACALINGEYEFYNTDILYEKLI